MESELRGDDPRPKQRRPSTAKPARQARPKHLGNSLLKDQSDGKKSSRRRNANTERSSCCCGGFTAEPDDPPAPAAIVSEATLNAGVIRLAECDRDFVAHMLAVGGPPPLRARPPGLEGLIWIIVSQQLSTASATAIFARLQRSFPGLTPAAVLAANDERLRGCGLSAAKVRTLRNLCEAMAAGQLDLATLAGGDTEQAHRALVAIKGIGPWTADIFLLSCLGCPDAWPAGDLALQEAVRLAVGLARRPNAIELATIAERWKPWRAVAARLLWAYYRAVKGRTGTAFAN